MNNLTLILSRGGRTGESMATAQAMFLGFPAVTLSQLKTISAQTDNGLIDTTIHFV
jgi:hypothetical protein